MAQIIQNRLVPDPLMTSAEYLHQRNVERERAEALGIEPRLSIGKVWVSENALTRLGALAFIRRRKPHHEMAAERFKSTYEAKYGAGNPAMDPSRVQVDTSPRGHDSGMAAKIDRTTDIRDAERYLGKPAFDRLVALLVLCIPVGDCAPRLPSGRPNDRSVKAMTDLVLADLDKLGVMFKLAQAA